MMPPRFSIATVITALSMLRPLRRAIIGIQLISMYSMHMLRKVAIQSKSVPRARPSLKRLRTDTRTPAAAPTSPFHEAAQPIRLRIGSTLSRLPRNASRRADSGMSAKATTSANSANAAPVKKTLCQPNSGISRAEVKPPTTAPSGKPQNIIATSEALLRAGEYSEASAMKLGIAPPSPRPVNASAAIKPGIDDANGVSSEPMHTSSNATSKLLLRPRLSPMRPNSTAPISPPSRPALKTKPNTRGVMCHATAISGAMNAIDCMLKPSIIATSPHKAMTRIWKRPTRCELISVSRST
jgi:hypothetical protein